MKIKIWDKIHRLGHSEKNILQSFPLQLWVFANRRDTPYKVCSATFAKYPVFCNAKEKAHFSLPERLSSQNVWCSTLG